MDQIVQFLFLEARSSNLQKFISSNNRRLNRRRFLLTLLTSFCNFISLTLNERRFWSRIRSSVWWDYLVLQVWNEEEFKENFRIERSTFDWLCQELKPYLEKKNVIRKPVSVAKQIAVTLTKLGSAGELRIIANLFGISRPTACVIVNRVCRAINSRFKITFPFNIKNVSEGFYNDGGLPGCCGALDGSHIPIKAPSTNAKNYFCRKQFHSILLQAVCDNSGKFLHVTVGWPGSVHDARVFANSNLFRSGQSGQLMASTIRIDGIPEELKTFLVADAAYPILPWLLKPYQGRPNAPQLAFNTKLSKSRVKVEHGFGMLKGRFRSLLKQNDCNVDNVIHHVMTCCILHNICLEKEDVFPEEWEVAQEDSSVADRQASAVNGNLTALGCSLRNSLLRFC